MPCARAVASDACLTSSDNEGLETMPLTGPPIDPRKPDLMFREITGLYPPSAVALSRSHEDGSEAFEQLRVIVVREANTEWMNRFACSLDVDSLLERRWRGWD